MLFRVNSNKPEDINRVFALVQNAMQNPQAQGLSTSTHSSSTTKITEENQFDPSALLAAISQINIALTGLQAQISDIEGALPGKTDIGHTVNGEVIETNPVLDGSEILAGPGSNYETDTIAEALYKVAAMFSVSTQVEHYRDLPQPLSQGTVVIVLDDETRNHAQTAYRSTGTQWQFVGNLAIHLEEYYKKPETYSRVETTDILNDYRTEQQGYTDRQISYEEGARDIAIASQISNSEQTTNQNIQVAKREQIQQANEDTDNKLIYYVPIERRVNGYSLAANVVINAADIPYTDTQSVFNAINMLQGAIVYRGAVQDFDHLPSPVTQGWAYTTENDMSIWVTGINDAGDLSWNRLGTLEIHLENYYTKEQTYTQAEVDTVVEENNEVLRGLINTAQTNATNTAINYTDNRLDNDIIPRTIEYQDNQVATLKNYTDSNKVDRTFAFGLANTFSITNSYSAVTMNWYRKYLNDTSDEWSYVLPNATENEAGMMTANEFNTIIDHTRRIQVLEQQGQYCGRSFQTYQEMMAYAPWPDWWVVGDWTIVQDDETHDYAISHYIIGWLDETALTMQWTYGWKVEDDPIPPFTNTELGIIKGSDTDASGYIKQQTDGTGWVHGWDGMENRMVDVETDVGLLQVWSGTMNNTTIPGLEADISGNLWQIDNLNVWSGTMNLTTIPGLELDIQDHEERISGLEYDADQYNVRITTNETNIGALQTLVGTTDSEGLRGQVATNTSDISSNSSAITTLQGDVGDLETDVGNLESGKADAQSITGATKQKITYNSEGIVTNGQDLDADDIPSLGAGKITSGTFGVQRGGTGAQTFDAGLIESVGTTTALTSRSIATSIAADTQDTAIPTVAAVKGYSGGGGGGQDLTKLALTIT